LWFRLRHRAAPVCEFIASRLIRQAAAGDALGFFEAHGHHAAPCKTAIAALSICHAHRPVTLISSNALCHPDGNGAPTTGGEPGVPTAGGAVSCMTAAVVVDVETCAAPLYAVIKASGFKATTVPAAKRLLTNTRSAKWGPLIIFSLAPK